MAANSDVVGAHPFMTPGFQQMSLCQGFVSTLIIVSSPNTTPNFGKQGFGFQNIQKLKRKGHLQEILSSKAVET